MNFRQNYYRKNGLAMRYLVVGQGDPILFLHGWGSSPMVYRKNILEMAKNSQVIAPELPFFGRSFIPKKAWGLNDYADFLAGFLDFLGLEKIKVVGHSLGGGISLILASKDQRISDVTVINSTGERSSYSSAKIIYLLGKAVFLANPKFSKENFKIGFVSIYWLIRNIIRNTFSLKRMIKTGLNSLAKNYDKELAEIEAPVKIIWSDRDYLLEESVAESLKSKIRSSSLKVFRGNHNWLLFKPEIAF